MGRKGRPVGDDEELQWSVDHERRITVLETNSTWVFRIIVVLLILIANMNVHLALEWWP